MRTILSLAAIAVMLTVTALQAPAGVTCKSDNGTEQSKHSFTQGACTADSDGSGAVSTAHGNGRGSNGFASAQTLGVSKAIAGAHSAATALSSNSGTAKAISDSRSLSNAQAAGGHAKAVSSSRGQSTVLAAGDGIGTAISDHHGAATANTFAACSAKATASTRGFANALCAGDGDDVTAEATGGATAQGSDTFPPQCDTSNGGTAKVRSPMGNCD
jgi:hypothetical protein